MYYVKNKLGYCRFIYPIGPLSFTNNEKRAKPKCKTRTSAEKLKKDIEKIFEGEYFVTEE